MKIDAFLLSLLAAIMAALLWPSLGTAKGPLHAGALTNVGIALVFFAHGVMLAPEAVRRGAAKWRLHLFIQLATFALFPVLGLLVYWWTRPLFSEELRVGFFLLAALPSTISSSVAMTAMARGDVVSAVFNASLSALIAIVVTPLLMQWISVAGGARLPFGTTVMNIALTLALPFAAGQLLRRWIVEWMQRHRRLVNSIDRAVIVLIVYSAFCDSTASGVWSRFGGSQLLLTALVATLMLTAMLLITYQGSRALGFTREEEIAAMFCGSKKSLASGAPIAKILFAGNAALGLLMLPLMLYHQIQLVVCTVLARRYAREAQAPALTEAER